ncbi:hypothetical protein [Abyssibius alkaniclasticus]|uniref:hypothetical protein n=1 Tax=Abyssibius alkaniclasticus TaxID=2881234 RepID=UPI004059E55E
MTSAKAALLAARNTTGPAIPHQNAIVAGLLAAANTANAQMLAGKAQVSPPAIALVARDAMLDTLEDGAFLQVLRAGPAPPVGLLALPPALVRQLACALAGTKPRGNAAAPSRVESALAGFFAHRLLEQLAEKLTPNAGDSMLSPLPNRGPKPDKAALQSRLPEGGVAEFLLPVQLDANNEVCNISIYFHLDFCNRLASTSTTDAPQKLGAEAQNWYAHMHKVALGAPIAARCIIDRFSLPTRMVAGLKCGDILPLPGLGLSDIALELPHRNGSLAFGHGKLGAARRNKALQLLSLAQDTTPTAQRLAPPGKPGTS